LKLRSSIAADYIFSLASKRNCGKRVKFCWALGIGICIPGSRVGEVTTRLFCFPGSPAERGGADEDSIFKIPGSRSIEALVVVRFSVEDQRTFT